MPPFDETTILVMTIEVTTVAGKEDALDVMMAEVVVTTTVADESDDDAEDKGVNEVIVVKDVFTSDDNGVDDRWDDGCVDDCVAD